MEYNNTIRALKALCFYFYSSIFPLYPKSTRFFSEFRCDYALWDGYSYGIIEGNALKLQRKQRVADIKSSMKLGLHWG